MSKIINQKDMKEKNLTEVLDVIRRNNSITRKEIQALTGLSWGGVSQIVSNLIELNFIYEDKININSSGRTPTTLMINEKDNFVLGIDINLTGLNYCVVNLLGDVIFEQRADADYSSKDSLLKSIEKLIKNIMKKYKIISIGMSVQGKVNEKEGISVKIQNIKGWENVPLKDIFTKKFKIPVHIAHDPDCLLKSSKTEEDTVLVRIDYGIGMAVLKNKNLISGEGMLEIGLVKCFNSMNNEYLNLSEIVNVNYIKNKGDLSFLVFEFAEKISNTLVLFNIKNLILCGELLNYKHLFYNDLALKLNDINIQIINDKQASLGAALLVMEKKMYFVN